MKSRGEHILEAAVSEFISSGQPITSELLFERFEFGIKPAMIRRELNLLSDEGFLYQRHPSGGRFPTDKAYRHFVKGLMETELEDLRTAADLAEEYEKRGTKSFVEEMSDFLGLLSVGYSARGKQIYESGLKMLLNDIEADRKEDFVEVVNDFESLPERLIRYRAWDSEGESWPRVFIGGSPFTKSEHLSVVAGTFDGSDGRFVLLAIGPKRMDYRKSLRVIKSLSKCMNHL